MLNLKNTLDGYLKNVEVIGNTIQDENNLDDIRSVGDKVEGQELYKIDVVSCGKNLFNKNNLNMIPTNCNVENNGGVLTITPHAYNTFNYAVALNIGTIKSGNYFYTGQKSNSTQFRTGGRTGEIVVNLGNETNKLINLTEDIDCILLNFAKISSGVITFDLNSIQIEPGTQATPYEPYQEQKLEILSPVQLEKVGDVADRIICKDGVWGVEKNINNIYPTFTHNIDHLGFKFYKSTLEDIIDTSVPTKIYFLSNHNVVSFDDRFTNIKEGDVYVSMSKWVYVASKLSGEEFNGIYNGKVLVKYPTLKPQFIPLPHDQQVKLRIFAGQTNIAFLTEIPGQIKAQVPKSLGATVNTHTEQIAELHNSLDRVKKLEETTVSTIETERSFTTVDATSNGYFEDVKLEGKTLVNKLPKIGNDSYESGDVIVPRFVSNFMPNSKHCIDVRGISRSITIVCLDGGITTEWLSYNDNEIKWRGILYTDKSIQHIQLPNECASLSFKLPKSNGFSLDNVMQTKILLLEGDHTNNPPEYFEGLMSVGQDVEETIVKSANINLLDEEYYSNVPLDKNTTIDNNELITIGVNDGTGGLLVNKHPYNTTNLKPNSVMRFHTIFPKNNRTLKGVGVFIYDGVSGKTITSNSAVKANGYVEFTVPSHGKVRLCVSGRYQDTSIGSFYLMLTDNTVDVQDNYIPYQSNKKPLLYYNPTTEMWEKPILREWDTIEKHSDGKYYYHKRSKEVVLNGNESWSGLNTSSELFNRMYISLPGKAYGVDNFVADNFIFKTDNVANISGGGFAWGNINNDTLWFTFSKTLDSKSKWIDHLQANPTTVVYQLAQEEVYECTNIDLMTYSGETNYIINSGAISPKSLLKVYNNISNVVKILQEKVSLLENTFIAGLKSVLSGDMYSLATILYPEDFEQNDNTEQDIMVIPE